MSGIVEGGLTFAEARGRIREVARKVFQTLPGVQSVGIIRLEDGGYGFQVVHNSSQASNFVVGGTKDSDSPRLRVEELPGIVLVEKQVRGKAKAGVTVQPTDTPHSDTLGKPFYAGGPLLCGVQIQNYDLDSREGVVAQGQCVVGTLWAVSFAVRMEVSPFSPTIMCLPV